jgi:hypothetical protein
VLSDCAFVAEPIVDHVLALTAAGGNNGIGDLKSSARLS